MSGASIAGESTPGNQPERPSISRVASTGDRFHCTVEQSHPGWAKALYGTLTPPDKNQSNCFRHALLSADGTAVVTYNEDLILRTFAVPSVNADGTTAIVSPYCTAPSPGKISSLTLHPAFDICNSASTLLLTAQPDLPIRLTNVLDFTYTHASYKWQNSQTEAYIGPSSLLFTDSQHFVAGAWDSIAVFDCHNEGSPIHEFQTRQGRKARRLYGADTGGIGGTISSLALSNEGTLAAGTYGRDVGLFDNAGQGECITAFHLALNETEDKTMKGTGISQIEWSTCGRYLFVAERQSDALLVYDIRKTGQRLSYLCGRRALTTLKLSFDLANTSDGHIDTWAGGTDGKVRVWRSVTAREGRIEPDTTLDVSQATVSNTILSRHHPMLMTTSGQRLNAGDLLELSDSDADSSDESESSEDSDSDSNSEAGEGDYQAIEVESGVAATVAAKEAWQRPAFDNTLAFWQIS